MALGDELRKAREAAGMTQEQVSFAAGVDRAHLSLLENGHKSPSIETFLRSCRAIGVRVSVVLARFEDSEQPQARQAEAD